MQQSNTKQKSRGPILKQGAEKPRTSAKPNRSRATTKSGKILALLRRRSGATIDELQTATGWQSHSIRGFLSGTVKKRLGLSVTSKQDSKDVRRYRIVEG